MLHDRALDLETARIDRVIDRYPEDRRAADLLARNEFHRHMIQSRASCALLSRGDDAQASSVVFRNLEFARTRMGLHMDQHVGHPW